MFNIDKLFGKNASYLEDNFLESKKLNELQENINKARDHIEYAIKYFDDQPLYCKGMQLALDLLNSYMEEIK